MKKLDFIFAQVLLITLGIFGILFFTSKKETYSEQEGRTLSRKPNIFFITSSKEKTEELETYYQDHFLFRNSFLEQQTFLKQIVGISINNGVYIGKDGYLLEPTKESNYSSDFIKLMNSFYETHNDIHMSLILLPSHVTIKPELVNKNTPLYDEAHQIKSIYHQITFDTIDVIDALKEGSKEYEMYYHLDSHLTSYGAFNIYREYSKFNDINTSIISFDIEEVTDEFTGDLVKKAHTFSYKKDRVVRFIPKNGLRLSVLYGEELSDKIYHDDKKDSIEDYFLGSTESLIQITNHIVDEKEILIVKDSSANVIIPFFVNDYAKVHVIDSTKYKGTVSDYLSLHPEIKDIVFLYKMNGLDSKIGDSLK